MGTPLHLGPPGGFSLGPKRPPNTLSTGVPFRITVDGVLCERVSIDGQWATIDGQPVYMEV